MTHLSLFTGIGGIDLAAEWAGFETVGQVEWADYPTKVLEKHWPNVPRWRDIQDVTAESFRERTGLRTVKLISGGFPCQPFSVAGKQKGEKDNRYLWPEMLRVIRELAPSWVLGENVPGILRIAADQICKDLEQEDYEVGIFDYEAAAVGAEHRRERIFFVGHSKHNGQFTLQKLRSNEETGFEWWEKKQEKTRQFTGTGESVDEYGIYGGEFGGKQCAERTVAGGNRKTYEIMADSNSAGLQAQRVTTGLRKEERKTCPGVERGSVLGKKWNTTWWDIEPDVGRVANGIPSRVDRLKCLGNAVVPQQVYPILQAIADIEKGC